MLASAGNPIKSGETHGSGAKLGIHMSAMSQSNLVDESRESNMVGSRSNWLGWGGMNGANSRGLLPVNSCRRPAPVVLCRSWSP